MNIRKLWQNLSISRKILILVWGMALLVLFELSVVVLATQFMTSVRAFVTGESHWSKSQKDAILNLFRYARTESELDYQEYQRALAVIQADKMARIELLKPNPNRERAIEGLMGGNLSQSDAESIYRVSRLLMGVERFDQIFKHWETADSQIAELELVGNQIHSTIQSNSDRSSVAPLRSRLFEINESLTKTEKQFASSLEELSRFFEDVIIVGMCIAILIVEATGILLAWRLNAKISHGLRTINEAAQKLGQGDLDVQLPVETKDELGQVALAFNRTVANLRDTVLERMKAEYEMKLKDAFLANMSHEMRTPLASITGFTELLKSEDVHPSEKKRYLEILEKTGANLTTIIDNVLNFTELQAGHLTSVTRSGSPGELLNDIVSGLKERYKAKNLNVQCEPEGYVPATITADLEKIWIILYNLIDNAFKFTDHGSISIHYRFSASQFIVDIRDSGVGIAREDWPRLFRPFGQIDDSLTKRFSGVGIGLALSRQLASAIGGEIVLLESELYRGSTFRALLPIQVAQSSVARTPTKDSQVSVLLVEDSPDNRLLIQVLLSKEGFLIETANDGIEGVEKALNGKFDLILMDMQMPRKDGYAATRDLRRMGVQTPIVALTAHVLDSDRERCLAAGCNDFLPKPVSKAQLLSVLQHYTGFKNHSPVASL